MSGPTAVARHTNPEPELEHSAETGLGTASACGAPARSFATVGRKKSGAKAPALSNEGFVAGSSTGRSDSRISSGKGQGRSSWLTSGGSSSR